MRFDDPKINEINYGVTYGSAVLKSLQNENMPRLDLLVREAVQNSSDAALGMTKKPFFCVDFRYGDFDTAAFNKTMACLTPMLDQRMAGKKSQFLEIRDTETSGLTGSYRLSDIAGDHGNYFKLIFDTGKKQQKSDAGGNWGFGKSVYYRVSMTGIVIFYTKVEVEGKFEERLIATLVEDEDNHENSYLYSINPRAIGRAWWGRNNGEEVLPITDPKEIEEFLAMFGLKPFRKPETGTAVIVPYVDEARLLAEVRPEEGYPESQKKLCAWTQNIPEYLKFALAKWYAPKLYNDNLKQLDGTEAQGQNKVLRATVNRERVLPESMRPLFQLEQELYTSALLKVYGKDYKSEKFRNIQIKEVKIRFLQRGIVGYVAYVHITHREMYPGSTGVSPYVMIGSSFAEQQPENPPITTFARQPGMIIAYSTSGEWSRGLQAPPHTNSEDDEYIVSFFVPDVTNKIKENRGGKQYPTLGTYLRECEGSDHIEWKDKTNYTFIQRIMQNVAKGIAEDIVPTVAPIVGDADDRLSNYIGNVMGIAGLGSAKPSRGRGRSGSHGGGSSSNFVLTSRTWLGKRRMQIGFKLKMHDQKEKTLRCDIQAESSSISPNGWAKKIGTPYPVRIESGEVRLKQKDRAVITVSCDLESPEGSMDCLSAQLERDADDKWDGYSMMRIRCDVPGQALEGKLTLSTIEQSVGFQVKAV